MKHITKSRVLTALLAGLMLLTLLGWTPRPERTAPVQVKDVDELVAAIGPGYLRTGHGEPVLPLGAGLRAGL